MGKPHLLAAKNIYTIIVHKENIAITSLTAEETLLTFCSTNVV